MTAQAARQKLNYQAIASSEVNASNRDRTDTVFSYGAGVSYRLGRSIRLGMTADHTRRKSGLALRGYQGTRVLGQVTYGL